jgi:CubicO group peptidase (beta-lactamase class C family)
MKSHRRPIAFLLPALCTAFLTLNVPPLLGGQDLPRKIDEIAEAEAKYDLFSGTVLVAKNGRIVYAKAFGKANKEYDIPNVLESKFNISSVQKSFIATLIMQLHQEGKIDLTDPLTKYFPDCPYKTANQIQIKNLLNHTSGLGDYRDNEEYQAHFETYTCIDDVLPLVFGQEPAFAPGERFRYSNAGVLLLKAIIERVEGTKLKHALEKRILHPTGMYDTKLLRGGDLLSHRATAYALADAGDSYVRVLSEPSAYGGGGIYTTVLDLLKFDQALYGEELLNEETKKIMFTPVEPSPDYAYGWQVVQFGGTTVVYHSGSSGGFNSEFRRYPEMGYTLIVLSNYRGAAFELANKVDSMLFGLPYSVATELDLHFRRGMFYQEREDYAMAIKFFLKNISSVEAHLPSLYQSARSRILGEFDQEKAIEELDLYIELADESTRPPVAAAWWRRGIANEQLGRMKQAVKCYKTSLKLDPGFELAQEALSRLETN